MQLEHAAPSGAAVRVEALESLAALDAIAGEWRALWASCERATVFQSPEWVLGWLRHLGGGQPRVLAVRVDDRLLGIVPLALGPGGSRVWTLAGTGPSDVLELVATTADAPTVARAALEHLAGRDDWDALELHELREGSPLAAAARAGLAGRVVTDTPLSVSPAISVPPGAHTLEEIVSRKWAHRVRRDQRACARVGLTVEIAPAEGARSHVREWARLHTASWRARGESGVLAGREAFVDDVFPALVARGDAEVFELRGSDGVLRASCLVLRERERAAYYLGGFDPEFAHRSPLVVLVGAALEHVARDGAREVDFLRGGEPYKYHWGATDRVQYRIRVERRTR